jgi:capsular polysaccharide biosynthesis protein
MRLRIGLVLSLALIGGLAAWVYTATATPTYTARAYLATTSGTPDAVHYARVYAELATGGPVLAQAAILLGPDPSGLDRVTATTSGDGPVIEIAARNVSAGRAATVADAAARALATYGSQRLSTIRGGLSVVAPAGVPARPSSPSRPRDLLIGASAGLLAGALAALLTLRRPPENLTLRRPPENLTLRRPPEALTLRRQSEKLTLRRQSELTLRRPPGKLTLRRPPPKRVQPVRPTFDDPAEIAGHLRIWRAQYGGRTVTAYRSAAALAEPGERADLTPQVVDPPAIDFGSPTDVVVIEPAATALNEPTETFVIIEPAATHPEPPSDEDG